MAFVSRIVNVDCVVSQIVKVEIYNDNRGEIEVENLIAYSENSVDNHSNDQQHK